MTRKIKHQPLNYDGILRSRASLILAGDKVTYVEQQSASFIFQTPDGGTLAVPERSILSVRRDGQIDLRAGSHPYRYVINSGGCSGCPTQDIDIE